MSSDMNDTEPFDGLVINGYGIYSPSDQKRLAALIVFQLVLTIGTLIISAVVGAIALIAEKLTKER